MSRESQPRPPAPEGVGFWRGPFSSFNGGPFIFEARVQWPEALWMPPFVEAKRAEHAFQAAKATSREDAIWVLRAPSAASAKARGSYHGERQPDGTWRRIVLRDDWEEIRFEVMLHVTRAKFKQLREHRVTLLATGDAFLYEDSPTDNIWGLWDRWEWNWSGQNLLGRVLMQVREELQ